LTAADLESYRPVWRPPVLFDAFDWRLASMDLPSSGGILLGQILGLAERLVWRDIPRFGAQRAHLLAEVLRRAFADRYLLGDPSTSRAHKAQLLEPRWLDQIFRQIPRNQATPSQEISSWSPDLRMESGDTTHLSVVDADGNAVALTTTLNGLFGCGLLVPEAGFFLNNEMDDFAIAPGLPNDYNLIQGVANAVGPGKRMLSSMSPTIVWRGNDMVVLGGRGGARIPTAVAQVLLHILVDDDPLQTAINRPRLHHQWLPDRLQAESDALSPETREVLLTRGHEVVTSGSSASVTAVRHLPSGDMEAAADPREPGSRGVVRPRP
jgi:gamma-glutamyltranspeptidase/glutathione hydrolase